MSGVFDGEPSELAISRRRPTLSDVSRCYRLLLGREVENATVAGQQIAASQTVGDLFERIWHSQEAVHHRMGEALGQVPGLLGRGGAEAVPGAERLDQLWTETLAAWARRGLGSYHRWLGRHEPSFDDRNPKWNVEQALARGEAEALDLLECCARNGRAIGAADQMAVLGAQAYRLGGALAPIVGRYFHFEIAPQDLELGMQAISGRGHANACGAMAAELRGGGRGFDLFYSVSALQYAPPPVIVDMLELALAALNPGGILICQLACQLHGYGFEIDTYLSGKGRDSLGEIHALPQREILALLATNGATLLEVVPDGRVGPLGISFTFVARKRA